MSKTTDSILRIRAQNLAKKDLRDVAKDLDAIAESQKKNETSAGLAARALRDLAAEQANLNKIAGELQRRGGLIGNVAKQKQDIADTERRLEGLRQKLSGLLQQKAGGSVIKGLATDIRNTETAIGAATRKLADQTAKMQQSAEKARALGIAIDDVEASAASINAEIARTENLIQENVAAQERHADALREVRAEMAQQRALQREIAAEAARRNAAEQAALSRRLQQLREIGAEQRRIEAKRADSIAAFSAAPASRFNNVVANTGQYGPAGDRDAVALARENAIRERLTARLNENSAAGERARNSLSRLSGAIRANSQALQQNSSSLDRHNRLQGIFADTGRKSLSFYQRLRGQILATAAAYVGLYQAVMLVANAATVEQQRRTIEIKIKMANNGDVLRTQKDIQFLRDEADRLGLIFEDLAKNYANFKIGARAAGLSQRETNETFKQAAEIVTALQLSTDDAEGVFRAFVQIMGKNKVQAEELNQQLGDRLPGAVAKFGQAMIDAGKIKTLSDLPKFIEDGQAGMREFLQFVEQYNKDVQGAVAESSKTLFANINRLKNAYRDFLVLFASQGVSSGLNDIVEKLLVKLKGPEGAGAAKALAEAFVAVGKALIWIIDNAELFLSILKTILYLQVAKAIVGIASAFITFGTQIWGSVKALMALRTWMLAAAAGTTVFSRALSVVVGLSGPIGLALGAIGLAFYGFNKAVDESKARMDAWLNTLNVLKTAQGEALAAGIDQAQTDLDALDRRIADTQARLRRRQEQNTRFGAGIFERTDRIADDMKEIDGDVKSAFALTRKLQYLQQQREGLRVGIGNATRRHMRGLAAEGRMEAADALEQSRITPPAAKGGGGKSAAEKAEDERERLEREAEARRDIADRSAKAVLDIEKSLADARASANAITDEQIAENTRLRLKEIESEIAAKRIDLQNLLRDSQAKGSAEGAANAQAALDKLPALQEALTKRAQEEQIVQRVEAREKAINGLIAERDARLQAIAALAESGVYNEDEARTEALRLQSQYAGEIKTKTEELIAFLQALPPEQFAKLGGAKLVAELQRANAEAQKLTNNTVLIGKNLGGQFASGVANAFGTLIKGLVAARGNIDGIKDAFKAAGAAFLDFLADFLTGIAQAILQAIILKAIMNAINGTSGGYWNAVIGALGGTPTGTGHTGGVVKSSGMIGANPKRMVSPALFANAERFHGGGLPGLGPREVPAILREGEEVLSESDPRNVLNGGMQPAASPMDLSIYNSIDSESVVEAGLNTRRGRRVIFNVIQANRAEFKRMLA